MRTRSLRWRLALTYAGMALLTAVILGGILLGVLAQPLLARRGLLPERQRQARSWPTRRRSPRCRTSPRGPRRRRSPPRRACRCTRRTARSSSTRGRRTPSTRSRCSAAATSTATARDHDGLPNPLGNGLFGTGGSARSSRSLTMDMGNGAYVKLSEGPASGRDALVSAAVAWILAAALAVGLAALAGYLVAARIARPVVALTEASDRMAAGDLGARAPVAGGDEVGRLGESFNGMAARVETTVTSLRRFVADAAHEIGTPLTALQADLELAERKAHERRRAPARGPGARPDRRASRASPTTCCSSRASRPASRPRERAERRPRGRGPRAGRRRGLARRAGRRRARGRRRPPARSPSPSTGRGCRPCSPTCSTTR